jgi:hypothetical protein
MDRDADAAGEQFPIRPYDGDRLAPRDVRKILPEAREVDAPAHGRASGAPDSTGNGCSGFCRNANSPLSENDPIFRERVPMDSSPKGCFPGSSDNDHSDSFMFRAGFETIRKSGFVGTSDAIAVTPPF